MTDREFEPWPIRRRSWPTPCGGASARPSSCSTTPSSASPPGNDELNAFVHLDAGSPATAAEAVDAAVARGEDPGPLAGVPFGVKDLEDCAGMPTSHGSLWFKGGPPAEHDDSTSPACGPPARCRSARPRRPSSASLNFASTKAWGVTRNPWDLERTPGGSSSGSAAAVAAGIVPARAPPATAAARSASRPRSAASSGTSRATAGCPTRRRCTRRPASSASSPPPSPTPPAASTCRPVPTTATAPRCRRRRPLRGRHRDARRRRPAGPVVARPGLRRPRRPRGRRAVAGPRPRRWPARPGWSSTRSRSHLTDATAGVALSPACCRPGRWTASTSVWPARAEELMPFTRRGFESSSRDHGAEDRPHPPAPLRVRAARSPRCSPTSTCCSRRPPRCRPSPPQGPPPGGAMATPFTMLANLCWNPATSVPAGFTADGLPVGLQIVGPAPPRRRRPPPGPDPRADPPLAPDEG